MAVSKLPIYPGQRTREALSPSQLVTLQQGILHALTSVLELPPAKRDVASNRDFIASYVKDHAQQTLHTLIWASETTLSKTERAIHQRVLRLAEIILSDLDLQVLIDLCVVFGSGSPKRVRTMLGSTARDANIVNAVKSDGIAAFTTLLSGTSQGLYGVRKVSYILLSFLKSAPPELVRPFARSKEFVVGLAQTYDQGLAALCRSYGGIRPERLSSPDALDDWQRIFLETKVSIIDSFHVILQTLLKDVEEVESPGPILAARCDTAFEIVFALLQVPASQASDSGPIPFLNQTILADYQQTYNLSRILVGATRRADDSRTELLEAELRSLDNASANSDPHNKPGVLKLLLRGSGAAPGIDARGRGASKPDVKGKGKGKAAAPSILEADPALDAAVVQVLDILSEQDPNYVRFVLSYPDYPYRGDAERLIEAIFEGTAPSIEDYQTAVARNASDSVDITQPVADIRKSDDNSGHVTLRRNIFDEERMDLSQVRVGKKTEDAATIMQDRTYIEQMKADILRRAEEVSDTEEEDIYSKGKNRAVGVDVAFEDEFDNARGVKVRDGEESEDENGEAESEEEDNAPKRPETILELAYIADPKLFDRDAETRRSKARTDLRTQTGWADGQIEGWRIMLERNPHKDKILQKHEFAGNRRGPLPQSSADSSRSATPTRGRGQGRGRGGGRGRGRGGPPSHDNNANEGGSTQRGDSGRGRGGGADTARDRAWKDKNKASRGNHNRKRGFDKKMARAGGPS